MPISKFLDRVMIIFIVSLLGCATSPRKANQDDLLEDIPEETELRRPAIFKRYVPLKSAQLSKKESVNNIEKSVPRHIASARDIQTALRNAGYYNGKIDGKIGPKSDSAIKAFQRDNGLKVDGIVRQRTWKLLKKHLSSFSEGPGTLTIPVAKEEPVIEEKEEDIATTTQMPSFTSNTEEIPVAKVIKRKHLVPFIVISIIILAIIWTISSYRHRRV